ncbi:hypothetical protein, partial [Desulforudis sp. 1190]|uniref:hypothetical protein n=1 Tax=Desulforudis sp. 1190 TaxID=3416136 RepID=UPI003CEEDD7F
MSSPETYHERTKSPGTSGRSQQLFHGHHIYKAAVKLALGPEDADFSKTPFSVQSLPRFIERKSKQDDFIEAVAPRFRLKRFQERRSHAPPPVIPPDIDGEVSDPGVGSPVSIGVQGSPPYDLAGRFGYQDGVPAL